MQSGAEAPLSLLCTWPCPASAERQPGRRLVLLSSPTPQWKDASDCKRAISSFTNNLRRLSVTICRSSIDGWALASLSSASRARWRFSNSARWASMDMLLSSPQPVGPETLYITPERSFFEAQFQGAEQQSPLCLRAQGKRDAGGPVITGRKQGIANGRLFCYFGPQARE